MAKYISWSDLSTRRPGKVEVDCAGATHGGSVDITLNEDQIKSRYIKCKGAATADFELHFPRLHSAENGYDVWIENETGFNITANVVATVDSLGAPATYTTGVPLLATSKKALLVFDGSAATPDFVEYTNDLDT